MNSSRANIRTRSGYTLPRLGDTNEDSRTTKLIRNKERNYIKKEKGREEKWLD
jgi:hypothetical protein